MLNKDNFNTFSMRQIPISEAQEENLDDKNLDKVKILELSNAIDKWEEEILFADNGFYALKGLEVKEKLPEFFQELDEFISLKISQISFSNLNMKNIALEIKENKLSAVKFQMKLYEQEQLKAWQNQVFEDALSCAIARAVNYKENDSIIESSLNNAMHVITAMAEDESWGSKIKENKIKSFKAQFYSSLIYAFIQDKNIRASIFFDKYKEFLDKDTIEDIQASIQELRINIIAYNYAKELFSYKLSDSENDRHISSIKDKDIKNAVKKYISDFKTFEKQSKELDERQKNSDNWQTIINLEEFDKALLNIDYSLNEESIRCKKSYISKIIKEGFIKTDKTKFLKLFLSIFDDFDKFKQKELSDYYECLSTEDFNLIKKFQDLNEDKFVQLNSDFKYLKNIMPELDLKDDLDKYDFIKIIISAINTYSEVNKKEADIESKNKIFEAVIKRYKKTEKPEKHSKDIKKE